MKGVITGISGPTVRTNLTTLKLYDRVGVGHRQLTGEVVRLEKDGGVIQAYEEPHGLAVGEPITEHNAPLLATLGPGLLATMYDGLQRPLEKLRQENGPFIHSAKGLPAIDLLQKINFAPTLSPGTMVTGGEILGIIKEGRFDHPVMVPPGLQGSISWLADGPLILDQPLAILDENTPLYGYQKWPVRIPRPYRRKLSPSRPIVTGQRVIDFLFPLARGGTAIIPGGFGAGKTILEHSIAKFADVDIIIFAGCGERGNEMSEMISEFRQMTAADATTSLMERTILVVNTSNMPVAAREASIFTAVTLGEYYRDMGYDVLLLADSISRWAEALREISSALEEMPGEEGYPTYLASRLASFVERAGVVETLNGATGSLSMILSVSPPGEDFTEPVTQALLRTTGAFLVLDSSLAHARHFPALSWSHSYSLYEKALSRFFQNEMTSEWEAMRCYCRELLHEEEALKEVVEIVGLEGLQEKDRLLMGVAEEIRRQFLGQNAYSDDAFSSLDRTLAMIKVIVGKHNLAETNLGKAVVENIIARENK